MDPLPAALVQAYSRRHTPYGPQLKIAKKGMTNDLGEFRLFGINFGDYVVSAGYGDRDRAAAIGRMQLSANVTKADDGYVPVFYDGAEEMSPAQTVHLAPGSDPGSLNIYLRDSARFRIRGQVLPLTSGIRIVFASRGSDLSDAGYFAEPNGNGVFEIRGVSPGSYLLLASTADGAMSSDVIPVTVTDTDIDGVRLTLERTMTVDGGVMLEGIPRTAFSGMRISLMRSSTEFEQRIEVPVRPDGTFTLEHVPTQGEYDIAPASCCARCLNRILSPIRCR
jgi:hypothetical protein